MARRHFSRSKANPKNSWYRLLLRLNCSTEQELARQLQVSVSAISGYREHLLAGDFQQDRKVWLGLLPRLASTFLTVSEMRDWLRETDLQLADWQWDVVHQVLHEVDLSILAQYQTPFYVVQRREIEESLTTALGLGKKTNTDNRLGGAVVSGMPGVGKTTVVAYFVSQTARTAIKRRFDDGVIWIDLENNRPDDALSDLAQNLGIKRERGRDIRPGLIERLRRQRILMVVDGALSLKDAEEFISLLDFSAGRVIVTSRELPAEPELNLMRNGIRLDLLTVPEMTLAEGVLLLEGNLKKAGDQFDAVEQDLARQLCHLTGGLPLALEIVSGLIQYDMTWQPVIDDIKRRQVAALAYTEDKGNLDKHGSVQICFDLSYERLQVASPDAARCFRSLGMLGGTDFSPAVWCQVLDVAEDQLVARCLRPLQRLNLISRRIGESYHVHTLLRGYARAKLSELTAECRQIERAYISAYGKAAESLAQGLGVSPKTFSGFAVNQTDIWHALGLALEIGDPVVVSEIILHLSNLSILTGQLWTYEDFLHRVESVLEKHPSATSLVMAELAKLAATRSDFSGAILLAQRALEAGLSGINEANCLLTLIEVYCRLDKADRAMPLVERLTAQLEKLSASPQFLSGYWRARGSIALKVGRHQEAIGYYRQANEVASRAGLTEFEPVGQALYGDCLLTAGYYQEAIVILTEVCQNLRQKRWPIASSGFSMLSLADALTRASDLAAANKVLDELEQEIDAQASAIDEAVLGQLLGRLWANRGAISAQQANEEKAISDFQESLNWWLKVPGIQSIRTRAVTMRMEATLHEAMRDFGKAEAVKAAADELLDKATVLSQEFDD